MGWLNTIGKLGKKIGGFLGGALSLGKKIVGKVDGINDKVSKYSGIASGC